VCDRVVSIAIYEKKLRAGALRGMFCVITEKTNMEGYIPHYDILSI
jgi:hypothetical protein